MRYVRIFLLYFQDAFQQRARSLVWFLISLFSPLLMVLFWRGASYHNTSWTFSTVSTYYFLLIIAGSLLMSHPEEDIAEDHIHNGNLTSFLMRPFPYFLANFMSELPWRIIQGFFGVIVVIIFYIFFGNTIHFSFSLETILMGICVSILGYVLGFTYKMALALLAFWVTELSGVMQISDILLFTFAGYIGPLFLFPNIIAKIAMILPFSYIIYFPVITFQGQVDFKTFLQILAVQMTWIFFFILMYKFLWINGIKKFSAVGQ